MLVVPALCFVLLVLLLLVRVVPLEDGVLLGVHGESADVQCNFVSGVCFYLSLTSLFPSVLSLPTGFSISGFRFWLFQVLVARSLSGGVHVRSLVVVVLPFWCL